MESPVVALIVALLALASIRIQQGDLQLDNVKDILTVGVLCGLCMLARTELILLVGLLLAQAVFWPATDSDQSFAARLRGGVAAGLTAVAVVAPWLAWNIWRFGTVIQVSALAHNLHAESLHGPDQDSGLMGSGSPPAGHQPGVVEPAAPDTGGGRGRGGSSRAFRDFLVALGDAGSG